MAANGDVGEKVGPTLRELHLRARVPKAVGGPVWLALGAPVAIGGAVRLWGVTFGLPYLNHPDEPTNLAIAHRMFITGHPNPHFFNYPSLFFYLNSLLLWPYAVVARVTGLVSPWHFARPQLLSPAVAVGYTATPITFLLGRLLAVVFGVGTIAVVFFIGRALTGRTAGGTLAALLVALSPTAALHSHFATPDAPATFFIALAAWASIRVFTRGSTVDYVVAGASVGLATSSKYNAALVGLALATAHVLRHGRPRLSDRRLQIAVMAGAAALLITMPFALLDFRAVLHGIRAEGAHYAAGHPGSEGHAFLYYLSYMVTVEGPVAFLAAFAVIRGAISRRTLIAVVAVFPVCYFVFISRFVGRNSRTLLPILPLVLALAAIPLLTVVDWARAPSPGAPGRRLRVALTVLLMTAVAAVPAIHVVRDDVQISGISPRQVGTQWIASHLPPGARIAVESYGSYVDPRRFEVVGEGKMIDHTPTWYAASGFRYLVFGHGTYGRYVGHPRYGAESAAYREFFSSLRLVAAFAGYHDEVRVYAIGP